MERYIRALSPRAEFTIVILIAFGYSILGNVLGLLFPSPDAPISEAGLQFLLVYEPTVIIALGGFLGMRGWSLQQLGVQPSMKDTGVGIGLAVVAHLVYTAFWLVSGSFVSGIDHAADNLVKPDLNLTTVIAISILNPVFEEVFVCGYIISALKNSRSASFAINVSVGVRLAYHLYQGTVGVISIIPLGLIFAHWFVKTGRLWPLVIAHALLDLVGLLAYVGQ